MIQKWKIKDISRYKNEIFILLGLSGLKFIFIPIFVGFFLIWSLKIKALIADLTAFLPSKG